METYPTINKLKKQKKLMKITLLNINNFIKNIPITVHFIILYGPDSGLICSLCNEIKKYFLNNDYNTNSIIELEANNIKKDPYILENSLYSQDMFSESMKKVITISNSSSNITDVISNTLKKELTNTLIILLAEDLPANNSLRKLAEKEACMAIVACYHDNANTLKSYIKNTLENNNYSISLDALNWLCNNLGNDRLITYQELNKLMLYKGENKSISITEVINVINSSNDLSLNEIVFDITLGNQIEAYKKINQFLLNFPAIVVIRALNNSLKRLLIANLLQNKKLDAHTIASKLSPPILFLYINKFKLQLSLWNINKINKYLKKLTELELKIKINPNLDKILLHKLTLDVFLELNNY